MLKSLALTHQMWMLRADSPNPSVARIVGSEGETGPSLGLSQDWGLPSY